MVAWMTNGHHWHRSQVTPGIDGTIPLASLQSHNVLCRLCLICRITLILLSKVSILLWLMLHWSHLTPWILTWWPGSGAMRQDAGHLSVPCPQLMSAHHCYHRWPALAALRYRNREILLPSFVFWSDSHVSEVSTTPGASLDHSLVCISILCTLTRINDSEYQQKLVPLIKLCKLSTSKCLFCK